MNVNLEGKYYRAFIIISCILLVVSIIVVVPLYEAIEDAIAKDNANENAKENVIYYVIDNKKYVSDKLLDDGSILLKRVNNEN